MTPRWIAYFVFLLLIGVVGYRNSQLQRINLPKAVWVATVDLPANTRIDTNHLQRPAFPSPILSWNMPDRQILVGKYTSQFIKKDSAVTSEIVGVAPLITNQTGKTLIYLPTQEFIGMPIEMNAGAMVFVCATESTNQFGPFTVEAIFGKSESTTLLIRVPTGQTGEVHSLSKMQLRLAGLPSGKLTEEKP